MKKFRIIRYTDGKLLFAGAGESMRDVVAEAVDRGIDLTRADLAGLDLAGISFRGARCAFANFTGSNLRHTDWHGAILTGAEIQEADFTGSTWEKATILRY